MGRLSWRNTDRKCRPLPANLKLLEHAPRLTSPLVFCIILPTKLGPGEMAPTFGAILVCPPSSVPYAELSYAPVAQWKRSRLVIDRLGVRIPSGALIGNSTGRPHSWRHIQRNRSLGPRWDSRNIGGVGEWLKPPDCKSGVRKGFVGSNPTPSTSLVP